MGLNPVFGSLFLILGRWVDCLLHEVWPKNCSHDTTSHQSNCPFATASSICNSLETCSVSVMAKSIQQYSQLVFNRELWLIRVVEENWIICNPFNNFVKCGG